MFLKSLLFSWVTWTYSEYERDIRRVAKVSQAQCSTSFTASNHRPLSSWVCGPTTVWASWATTPRNGTLQTLPQWWLVD